MIFLYTLGSLVSVVCLIFAFAGINTYYDSYRGEFPEVDRALLRLVLLAVIPGVFFAPCIFGLIQELLA